MEVLLIIKSKSGKIFRFRVFLDKYWEEREGVIYYSYLGINITIKATKIRDDIFEVSEEQMREVSKLVGLNRIRKLNDILESNKVRSIKKDAIYFLRSKDDKGFYARFFYFETIKEEDLRRINSGLYSMELDEFYLIGLDEILTRGRIRLEEDISSKNKEIIDIEVEFLWVWDEEEGWIFMDFHPIDETEFSISIYEDEIDL